MFTLNRIAFPGIEPVSLEIPARQCLGMQGESGCGKTRLLRAIADMDEHDGSARLDGVDANSMEAPQWRRQVALLPAESQWWHDTVGEHFPDRGTDLSALGFAEETWGWEVSRCSSGERQRLAILRCLANRPRVLLLDEPTANLDPDNTLRVEALIVDYLAQNEACCIWVSHNRLQLQRIAQRCLAFFGSQLREAAVVA